MKKDETDVLIAIKGMQELDGLSGEGDELVTPGTYSMEGNIARFSYMESELTGMEGTKTTFEVRPSHVSLIREGTVNAQMVFEQGKKHFFMYETTFGAFTRDPLYNNLQKRDVKVSCQMKCLFTPEELANTKVREIDEVLDREFTFDYFKWQQDNNIEIDEPFRADGLNRILYKCPHCMSEGKTIGKGITLTCTGCGAEYELDTLGRLKAKNVESRFDHIPDWFAWEREQVKEELENGTYLLDVPCDIAILKDSKALYMVGTGRLRHDINGFVLDGCDGKLHYEQSPGASYSVNSDYFWYEI